MVEWNIALASEKLINFLIDKRNKSEKCLICGKLNLNFWQEIED